jgi:hypothetical protein
LTAGTNLTGAYPDLALDYDGDLRNAPVDIGADEFVQYPNPGFPACRARPGGRTLK